MCGVEFLWPPAGRAGDNHKSCWGRSNSATEAMPPFDWYHLIYPRTWWFFLQSHGWLNPRSKRSVIKRWSVLAFLFYISWVINYVLYHFNDRKNNVERRYLRCLRTGFAAVFFTLTVVPVHPLLLPWCGGCREQYLTTELSTRAIRFVLLCIDLSQSVSGLTPVLLFYVFPGVASLRAAGGSDLEPTTTHPCVTPLSVFQNCVHFYYHYCSVMYLGLNPYF